MKGYPKGWMMALALLSVLWLAQAALPPVENRPPNTRYQPAFEGQTRALGTRTQTPYEIRMVSHELENPWGIAALPDGRLLISQRAGSLRMVNQEGQLGPAIGGFAQVAFGGQGGLLDVALAPDFDQSRMIYVSFSEAVTGGSLTALGRGRLSQDEGHIEGFEVLYRAGPAAAGNGHYGSRIAFQDSDSLFLSTGDRQGLDTRPLAQQWDNGLGKIIRITGLETGPLTASVYSIGHRNVQGLALDDQGQLWASEMGPRGGDELNLIQEGQDYGWPSISYGLEYSGEAIGRGITQMAGTAQPQYYWDPVLAPSGMCFYQDDAMPEWRGNLFISGLASQHISRLVLDNNLVVAEERLLADEGQRFRDIAMGGDGALYAITDQGRLYRIGQPALPDR